MPYPTFPLLSPIHARLPSELYTPSCGTSGSSTTRPFCGTSLGICPTVHGAGRVPLRRCAPRRSGLGERRTWTCGPLIGQTAAQGPQQPSVKQTASGPHSALLVHTTEVQTCCTQAAVPSVVDTQPHPGVALSHVCTQPVPFEQVSAHVGTQKARGARHCPLKKSQKVPGSQQVTPVALAQQVAPDGQQAEPVGPEQILLTSPRHCRQACPHEA